MKGNVLRYYASFSPDVPPEIMSQESYLDLYRTASLFRDFLAVEYILETRLDSDERTVDFSFCMRSSERDALGRALKGNHFKLLTGDDAWQRVIGFVHSWSAKNTAVNVKVDNIWLEMDAGEYRKATPRPCFFFDASKVKSDSSVDKEWLCREALKELLDNDLVEHLRDKADAAIRSLPPGTGLFQVGTMLARNRDRVRFFTSELSPEQAAGYLKDIGWPGDCSEIEKILNLLDAFSDGRYILDFDLSAEGISPKVGVNFGLKNRKVLPFFLKELSGHNLCNALKRKGMLAWSGSSCRFLGEDYGQTALIRNISHFKVSCSPGERIRVKAYLRILGIYLKELFKHKPAGAH